MSDQYVTRIVALIKRIPRGRVATYGQVATLAGNPKGARQVVRALHSSSDREKLPWFRVINAKGQISLPRGSGFELQRALLESEGVVTDEFGRVDLNAYLWKPNGRRP